MAAPSDRLAASLEQLAVLQKDGRRVFRSGELTRVHRERLLANGFIREAMKGWLISSSPGTDPGDTTSWFACFWEFCARYCAQRFGDKWHLSPEQSLLLHADSSAIPLQVVVYTPQGANNTVELPFGTSLYDLKHAKVPSPKDLVERDGLWLYVPEAALTSVSATFFTRNPVEAQVVLAGVRDSSDVLRLLLDGGHSTVAGRLAGAFRRVDRADVADDIITSMKAAGYDVRETDPFAPSQTFGLLSRAKAPIVGRLQAMWEASRDPVIEIFPEPPGLPRDQRTYLGFVDDSYRSDAYHSLSIEGCSPAGPSLQSELSWATGCSATSTRTPTGTAAWHVSS